MAKTKEFVRKTGVAALDGVPWGTHFCMFYQTKEDLLGVLVPYFKAGLEGNEFCMGITSEPRSKAQTQDAMRKAMPNFDQYLKRGQMEIKQHNKWYLKQGTFEKERVLQGWMDKLSQALAKGYLGMRIAGELTWLNEGFWKNFIDYEGRINEVIDRYQMIVCCAYCLAERGPGEIVEVVNTHQLALIRQGRKSKLIKNAERKRAKIRARQYQAQLKSLASQLTLAEERERRRIATELHDRISQSLALSKVKLDAVRHSMSPGESAEVLTEVSSLLGQTIAHTRSLTSDLSSPILNELGFESAVASWLAEQIESKHHIRTEFQDDGQPKVLDDDVRALLFRNVRELLINTTRHAKAQHVKVSIRRLGSQVQIRVQDDGVGFEPAEATATAARGGGFGLFSVKERLEQIGGHLEIESEPGRGCKVTMTAPLKQDGT